MTTSAKSLKQAFTPLVQLSAGQHARIAEVRGNQVMTRRLLSLGLRVGSEVTILHHRGRGVVVTSAGNRVALGEEITDKLFVEWVKTGNTAPDDFSPR